MSIGMIIGGSLTAYSASRIAFIAWNTPARKFKRILRASLYTHTKRKDFTIKKLENRSYGFKAILQLPSGFTVAQMQGILPGISQDTYSEIEFHHIRGRHCQLKFGTENLNNHIPYSSAPQDQVGIPLKTAFGWKFLDLRDDSSCHLLGGGATRMGKTAFIKLLITHIFTQLSGECDFLVASAKHSDFHMFKNIPGITISDSSETSHELHKIQLEMEQRKSVIEGKGNVADAHSLAEKYPQEAFKPLYVIVDEVGAFSDDEYVEKSLIELSERAGYLDIHLVIFAQRPEATNVLNGRVRANLLANISFTTRDEANSRMIIGNGKASHLGRIQGRAILVDSMESTVQVPYISDKTIHKLLSNYRSDSHDEKGSENHKPTEALPSFVQGSIG